MDPPESLIPTMTFYYGGGRISNNDTLYVSNIGGTAITGLTASVTVLTPATNLKSITAMVPSSLASLDIRYVTVSVVANGTASPTKVQLTLSAQGISFTVAFKVEGNLKAIYKDFNRENSEIVCTTVSCQWQHWPS